MYTDPKTKEQFMDRILSLDFDGDFTELGAYRAKLRRIAPNKFSLDFPATGQNYELVVRKPRLVKRKPRAAAAPIERPKRGTRRSR